MRRLALVTDFAWPDLEIERAILASQGVELVVARSGEAGELEELAPTADAILTNWKPVGLRVLERAERCVTVARYGVGVDNIDVAAATELGIVVTNVPDYCVDEVAEHALALLFALARQIVLFAEQTRAGGWDNQAGGPLHRLRGRTLGLVGYGRTARALAARAAPLGLRVLAYAPTLAPGDHGVVEAVASLGELLERSDAVSLHAPLTAATRHLIGAAELARMRPRSFLVNTARGALVDEEALLAALREGRIAGAGLDVMGEEPAAPDHPLRSAPGVIMTPHAAFFSVESVHELEERAANNVAWVLRGQAPAATVNPEVLSSPALRMARRD